MRRLKKHLQAELSPVLEIPEEKNTRKNETRMTSSTSNQLLARKIEDYLSRAAELERSVGDITEIMVWIFEVDSFLEESFGEDSERYVLFPRIPPNKLTDATVSVTMYYTYLRNAKNYLEDVLREVRKAKYSNNNGR